MDTVTHSPLPAVPGRLVPTECVLAQGSTSRAKLWPVQPGAHVWEATGVRWGGSQSPRSRGQGLEDYVAPGQLRLYRINTAHLRPGSPISVQVGALPWRRAASAQASPGQGEPLSTFDAPQARRPHILSR